MNNTSILRKLRYYFDNSFSRGSFAVLSWLGVAVFLILLLSALVIYAIDIMMDVDEQMTFGRALYESYYQILAGGAIDIEENPAFRWVMAILCLVGIVFVSIFIGLITSGIEEKIEDLKRGRSAVLEKNHILIYGWSNKVFQIINELILASENLKHNTIVLLANKDKVEMDEEISEKIESFKTSKVITRSGSTIDTDDINIVNPYNARAIIILPTEEENSDINVIKTLMALINDPKKKKKYNIVTEINDPAKIKVAKIIGKDEVSVIQTGDVISRIMVQTCRQPGLSSVYRDLLAFEGNEIYFKSFPQTVGKTFGELVFCFEECTLIGIYKVDHTVLLVPKNETIIEAEDQLIFVAIDDNLMHMGTCQKEKAEDEKIDIGHTTSLSNNPTLIIGWNDKVEIMLKELDAYVSKGSLVSIVADKKESKVNLDIITSSLKNINIEYTQGDTTDIDFLKSVDITKFGHIILLCYDSTDIQDADAKTLITLVHLRELSNLTNASFNVVSEMKDIRNKALAELAKPDDFVISDNITSLVLSQITENRDLLNVFDDLFSAKGAELYLKPVSDYVKIGENINFYTISKAALAKNEIAIGYRINKNIRHANLNYGIVNNPKKSKNISFEEADKLIILAH